MSKGRYNIQEALNSSKAVDYKIGQAVLEHDSSGFPDTFSLTNIDISGNYSHILLSFKYEIWMTFAKDLEFTCNGTNTIFPGGAGVMIPGGQYIFQIPQYVDVAYSNTSISNTTNTDIGYTPEKINPGDPLYLRCKIMSPYSGKKIYYWLM